MKNCSLFKSCENNYLTFSVCDELRISDWLMLGVCYFIYADVFEEVGGGIVIRTRVASKSHVITLSVEDSVLVIIPFT